MGITERGDIILEQADEDHVITISPDQVEELIASLRIAVQTLQDAKNEEKGNQ